MFHGFQVVISIHAPRAGRDERAAELLGLSPISIHAPRAGRDESFRDQLQSLQAFQSTRPVRGATCAMYWENNGTCDFNPRAPCGARQSQ